MKFWNPWFVFNSNGQRLSSHGHFMALWQWALSQTVSRGKERLRQLSPPLFHGTRTETRKGDSRSSPSQVSQWLLQDGRAVHPFEPYRTFSRIPSGYSWVLQESRHFAADLLQQKGIKLLAAATGAAQQQGKGLCPSLPSICYREKAIRHVILYILYVWIKGVITLPEVWGEFLCSLTPSLRHVVCVKGQPKVNSCS